MILNYFLLIQLNNLIATHKKLNSIFQIELNNKKTLRKKYIKLELKWSL